MFQQIRLRRSLALQRNHENGEGVVQGSTRAKIEVALARLQHSDVARLVTIHADVVRQKGCKLRGVNNCRVSLVRDRRAFDSFFHVQCSRAVAVLTSDGKFLEWRIAVKPVCAGNRPWPTAMADDTPLINWAIKSVIADLIPGRKGPAIGPRIERQGRFKQIIASLDDTREPVCARPNDEFHFSGSSEDLSSILIKLILTLIKVGILAEDFKIPIQLLGENYDSLRHFLQVGRQSCAQGSAHVSLDKPLVN